MLVDRASQLPLLNIIHLRAHKRLRCLFHQTEGLLGLKVVKVIGFGNTTAKAHLRICF